MFDFVAKQSRNAQPRAAVDVIEGAVIATRTRRRNGECRFESVVVDIARCVSDRRDTESRAAVIGIDSSRSIDVLSEFDEHYRCEMNRRQ